MAKKKTAAQAAAQSQPERIQRLWKISRELTTKAAATLAELNAESEKEKN